MVVLQEGFSGREPRISRLKSLSRKAVRGEEGRPWDFGKCLIRLCALSQKLKMRNNTDIIQYPGMLLSPARLVSHARSPAPGLLPRLDRPPHHFCHQKPVRLRHYTPFLAGTLLPERGVCVQRPRAATAKTPQRRTPRRWWWARHPPPRHPHHPPPQAAAARGRCRPAQWRLGAQTQAAL